MRNCEPPNPGIRPGQVWVGNTTRHPDRYRVKVYRVTTTKVMVRNIGHGLKGRKLSIPIEQLPMYWRLEK